MNRDRHDREEWGDLNFADPRGRSALRASSPNNPRDLPCPTCGESNRLTLGDVRLGYQCDACADHDEGNFGSTSYGEY